MTEALPEPLFERTTRLLHDLTAISSASGDLPGLRRMAERLGAEVAARGLAPEIREEAGEGGVPQPVLVAHGANNADTSRGYLLLIGHMDTVLPAAEPRIEDGRLVATGAIDMKGGLAAFLGALDLLAHRGVKPPDDLLLVVVPDEEVGGPISHAAMQRWGPGARALWVLEPGEPAGDAETMVAGRRGMFDWHLTVRGQAAHSGLHYWDGRSALAAAARWCTEAQALSTPDGGPTVNVGRLVAGDASFVEDLATAHALLGTERQLNVVPDRAIVEGETRFLRASEEKQLESRLRDIARRIGTETGTEMFFTRQPLIPPVDPDGPHGALCKRAVDLAADRGWTLEIERERGGISFPNFLPDPGRLPVLDGLGPVGGGMHTREEYVELRSLQRRVVLLADLLGEAHTSLLELAAMKVKAIQDRAEAKDYLDLHRLLEEGLDLSQALGAALVIYGETFNPLLSLKALCYFGDGDLRRLPEAVKNRLAEAAASVDPDRLPRIQPRPGGLAP